MPAVSNVLVIGTGSIGERHVRCFGRTGRATLGICEVNPTLRRQVADRYGIERAYANVDTALQDAWDAAVICTPANLHVPMARQLADSGISMLIEKPLSTGSR